MLLLTEDDVRRLLKLGAIAFTDEDCRGEQPPGPEDQGPPDAPELVLLCL